MSSYLCGIDVGTTGAKTMVFDLCGKVLGSAYREYGCTYPRPNWVEQDIEMVLDRTFETCREAVEKAGIGPADIAAISLSTQRTTSIFLDDQERVLKTISWQDNRTNAEMREIAAKIAPQEYYRRTGLPLNTTWIITKVLWMQKNEPETWKKVRRVVQLQDYILRNLGADDYYIDYPDACLFGCFDSENYTWDRELMQLSGLKPELMPVPMPCATRVGVVSAQAMRHTGFAIGTPICVGAGDQNSASIGAGIVQEGRVSVSLGTGGMAIAYLDRPYRDPDSSACITCHAMPGAYQFEGYQTGAASVFRWFRDEMAAQEKLEAARSGENIYAILDREIERVPVGAKGLVMMPYFASATSPRWNPDARGTLMGLTFAHDRACVARACMEGITLEQKDIITNMISNGIRIDSVRIIGGATKGAVWNQIQADMYRLPCETLDVPDAAVMGAAIMAGTAIGIFRDIPEAVRSMISVRRIYEPITAHAAVYDEMYEIYCAAYQGFAEHDVFGKLARLQAKY